MEILGIGPVEFIFFVIILLLVLGPAELGTLGRKIGEFIRKVRTSETWILLANLARTIRNLPTALADEVGVEDLFEDVVPGRSRRTIAPPRSGGAGPGRSSGPPVQADAYSAWTTPAAEDDGAQEAGEDSQKEKPVEPPVDRLDG